MIFECPGSRKFKQPYPENIRCPHCRAEVEIWTDESRASCQSCKIAISRESEQSCINWCRYARECVGMKEILKK